MANDNNEKNFTNESDMKKWVLKKSTVRNESSDLFPEEIKDEIGEFVTGSYCPVCKSWWDGTNTGPDKYSLEPTYVHDS